MEIITAIAIANVWNPKEISIERHMLSSTPTHRAEFP
jgi:hypothetical protein